MIILSYQTVQELCNKYDVDINQFYDDSELHSNHVYIVEEYKRNVLFKSFIEIINRDCTPVNTANKEYHLTIPTSLVIEFLAELGLEIGINISKTSRFQEKFSYTIEIECDDLVLPRDSYFTVLPSLDSAIDELLLVLLKSEVLRVENRLFILNK